MVRDTDDEPDGGGWIVDCDCEGPLSHLLEAGEALYTADQMREYARAALSAVEALGQQAEPVLGEVWMAFGRLDDGRLVALPEYAAVTEGEVGSKIMDAARREGFRGLLAERLNALGWTICRVAPAPLQQQEAGSLSDEQIVEIRDRHLPSQGEPFDCIAFARELLACAPSPTEPKAAEGRASGYDGVTTHPEFGRNAGAKEGGNG